MPSHWLGSIAAQTRGEQREEGDIMKERSVEEGGGGGKGRRSDMQMLQGERTQTQTASCR